MDKKWLEFLREQFPVGSRIKLREMKDPYAPVEPGTMGTLEGIDDVGSFLMSWDNGRTLSLVLGEDSFTVLPPQEQTLKLDMPMTVGYFDDDGDWNDEIVLDSHDSVEYASQIIAALEKERQWLEKEDPDVAERGLMAYYGKEGSVVRKVRSYHFTAEVREGRLWGAAVCKVQGELTPKELEKLMDSVSGQASDGVGESFEQQEIWIGSELKLYAHLWQQDRWSIMTEQDRFDPRFAESLPELCWSVLPSDGTLICIQRGESGYLLSDWNQDSPEQNRRTANYNNERRGISKAQEQAMLAGSMFGWNCPAADPKRYMESEGPQMGGMILE